MSRNYRVTFTFMLEDLYELQEAIEQLVHIASDITPEDLPYREGFEDPHTGSAFVIQAIKEPETKLIKTPLDNFQFSENNKKEILN